MNLREYIEALKAIERSHGDIPVMSRSGFDVAVATGPQVRYLKVLTGRERKMRLWQTYEGKEFIGEKVVDL